MADDMFQNAMQSYNRGDFGPVAPAAGARWNEAAPTGQMAFINDWRKVLHTKQFPFTENLRTLLFLIQTELSEAERKALTLHFEQRGISRENAIAALIHGFCKDVFKQLPMEFAVEAQKLLTLKLENSVG